MFFVEPPLVGGFFVQEMGVQSRICKGKRI